MRTNIVIDDELMAEIMESGDFATKREAVEAGLRSLLLRRNFRAIKDLEGIGWGWEEDAERPSRKSGAGS